MTNKLFNITEESLYDMIKFVPHSAHLKDASNGKYLATNKKNISVFNFSKLEDFIDLTIDDLDYFMKPYWGAEFAEWIVAFDEAVKLTGRPIEKNTAFMDINGFVRYFNIVRTPLISKTNEKKVNAILTVMYEYTNTLDLIDLYYKYKEIHKSRAESLYYFTKYLGILDLFYDHLTEKELLCLLEAKYNQTHKNIAGNLGISLKTVETHMANIANKLKEASIQDIILLLRGKS